MISCHFEFKAIHGIWGMFVDYIAIVTVDCPSNGENITEVISFVKVWMNITGLVSLFHNEHVQHVWPACFPMLGVLIFTCVCWVCSYSLVLRERERERERDGLIIRSSFYSFFFFFFFNFFFFFFFWDFPPTFNFITIHGGYIEMKKTKYRTLGNQ